jgi:transposase InsO family protein
MLLGVIDDCSRLVCHLQWYLDETAESLVHGLSQAFMKRGLPRALMTDNGAAMLADETVTGLEIHYMYVKESFRRFGVARRMFGLIEDKRGEVLQATHSTPAGRALMEKAGCLYNPYLLFQNLPRRWYRRGMAK